MLPAVQIIHSNQTALKPSFILSLNTFQVIGLVRNGSNAAYFYLWELKLHTFKWDNMKSHIALAFRKRLYSLKANFWCLEKKMS